MNQNDVSPGLDPSPLVQISGAQLLQLVMALTPSNDRGFHFDTEETPDVATYPNYVRYTWTKPSENRKTIRTYNSNTNQWEPVSLGNLSIGTNQIQDGAVTLAKLFNPGDITKKYWLIRVNATGTGFELWPFSLDDNSITLAKIKAGPANTIIHRKLDGSGWEYLLPDDLMSLLSDQAIGISKLNALNTKGAILITNSNGNNYVLLGPGIDGQILRSSANGPYWSNEAKSLITSGFTSANQNIPAGNGQIIIAHGLGGIPPFIRAVLVCVTPDHDYVAGDEVSINSFYIRQIAPDTDYPIGLVADATNITFSFTSDQLTLIGKNPAITANFAVTRANWQLKVYAYA